MGVKSLTLTFTRGLPAAPTDITWVPDDGINPLVIRTTAAFQTDDVLTIQYSTDGTFVAGVTTVTPTMTSSEAGNGRYDYPPGTLADGTYYTRAKITRSHLGTPYTSAWKTGTTTFTFTSGGTWPVAADYTINNDADWATIPAGLQTGGGIIDVAYTTYTAKTLTLAPSAELVFRQQTQGGNRPKINVLTLTGAANLTFDGLDLYRTTFDGGDVVRPITTASTTIEFRNCTIRGNYLGDVDAVMDPATTYTDDLTQLPNGFGGSVTINGLRVIDCSFSQLYNCIKFTRPSQPYKHVITGCTFNKYYSDAISGNGGPDPSGAIEVVGNLFMNRLSATASAPHSDASQYFHMAGHSSPWDNLIFNANVVLTGTSPISSQGFFSSDVSEQPYRYLEMIGNIIASTRQANQVSVSGHQEAYIAHNTNILYNPNVVSSTCNFDVDGRSYTGATTFPGYSYVGYNISEVGPSFASSNISGESNLTVTAGSPSAYAAAFSNPTANPTTRATAAAAYTGIGSYVNYGATKAGLIDWTTYAIDRTLLPSFIKWDNVTGAARSTTVEATTWSRLMGGPTAGRTVSITGGEYSVADDINGTNASAYTSASQTVTPGKYIKVRLTSSGAYSTTVSATLTINSQEFTFSVTTASSGLAFTAIDNNATAYSSKGSSVGSDTGIQKYLMACRYKFDAAGVYRMFSHNSTNGRTEFYKASASKLVLSLGQKTMEITYSDDQAWHTLIAFIDTTQATAALGFRAWIDNAEVTYLTRAFTSGATTSISTALGQFNLFSKGGTQTCNGQMQYLWMDWGDSAYTLLDVSQQSNRDLFLADNINLSTGAGPTGSQPKLFFTGNQTAATWNAGLPNLGSLGGTWAKTAGTYT